MKRKGWACFLALLLGLSLVSCGAVKMDTAAENCYAMDQMVKTEASTDGFAADRPMENVSGGTGDDSVLADQKVIYTGSLELETTEFDDTVKALAGLAGSLGGYLESSTVSGGSRGYRWADHTIRVPADAFDRFFEQAGALAHVTRQSTELKNITETYYDTEGRLKTQQIKLERLQKLLSQAENMEDIITIESAISETEWSIENLSGTLRHYDALVDLATITVSIREVYKLSETETLPEGFGARVRGALSRGGNAFADSVEDLIVTLAYNWLWLLLWGLILTAAVVTAKKLHRRRKAARAAQYEKNGQEADDKREKN